MSQQKHIPALDGLRGIAILLVMMLHFATGYDWSSLGGIMYWQVACAGWCGVDLFFVLSGFLITGILYRSKSDPFYFVNFYTRRALRIFPLYYGVLIILLVALPAIHHFEAPAFNKTFRDQGWAWIFCVNILESVKNTMAALVTPVFSLNGLWSLAVEEHFYLIWPSVVIRCGRRMLMKICAVLFVVAPILRIILLIWKTPGIAAYAFTLCRMDSLAAGAFVALAVQGDAQILKALSPKVFFANSMVAALSALCLGSVGIPGPVIIQALGHTVLALLFASVIALIVLHVDAGFSSALEWRPLREIGKVSYGMYVFHTIFVIPLNKILPMETLLRHGLSECSSAAIHGVAAGLIVYCISWLSFQFFESPINRLKRYFYPATHKPVAAGDITKLAASN